MMISDDCQWSQQEILSFLAAAKIPLRASFCNTKNEPMICSLWFKSDGITLWAASHENSYLIKQLKHNQTISFEVSTNEYPYKGVRGKATVELVKNNADAILHELIDKYLGNSNNQLATWLLSRASNEYAIKITPSHINSWDFSDRMPDQQQ
ncbi:hypothetical protein EDC56_3642 [Sinobacterium caligoides]|uniref:Pyridoxamine 5'-phosphate oxidase n=1 Tax=Sinobacterium caligoides TaxID=933926 RepID=A0A3N2DDW8_9GAMM|nr:hypothetical protein [Sinobacterium caligoides]ROR97973.1 hypothetical protein EDC56_3642 [Sinobacterium caligoides]